MERKPVPLRTEAGVLVQDAAREVTRGQFMKGLRGSAEDMGLCPKGNEKALRGFKEGRRGGGE